MSSTEDTVEFVVSSSRPGWDLPQLYSARTLVDIGALSHAGLVRASNEDHFFVARFGRYLERLFTNIPASELAPRFDEMGYGAIVADGVGGHAAGEAASKLAISTFINLVLGTPDWILRLDDDQLPEEVKRRNIERFGKIEEAMEQQVQADPSLQGFATTMTLAVSLGKMLMVTHLGDSRAYLLRKQRLYRLTRDHTMAQELADEGRLPKEAVPTHRWRHVLTRSLSAQGRHAEPDVQDILLEDEDVLLLCSDGLTEMVRDERITTFLQNAETAEKACQSLLDEALKAGGKDNVTVVVIRYRFPQS
jgi:protein phosphatase